MNNPTNAQSSDIELIEAVRAGSENAFRRLVERYEPVVATTVIGMLGRCPEARDVGQQVFIRFFRSAGDFRGDASLKTYLTRIAINLSLNELKRRKRERSRYIALDDDVELPGGPQPDPEASEKVAIVQRAIDQLEPGFKAVVNLRMMQGHTVKETAEMLGVPSGTVLSRLSRARVKLANLLQPYVDDDGDRP